MASLKFKGTFIRGSVLRYTPGAFEVVTARTHFAGLHGVSEIPLGSGMRRIEIGVWLHANTEEGLAGFATRDELNQYIRNDLNKTMLGLNGVLEYESDVPDWNIDESDCTFEGYERTSNDLEDMANTGGGGWTSFGVLRFTQLSKQ